MEIFKPKKRIKERYSLTEERRIECENNKKHKQMIIKQFMDNGMGKEGATLQAMRKMYVCG